MSNDSLLHEFISECQEHLNGIESDLLVIEESGVNADPDIVNKVFRAAHSIKGGAGFFNLEKIKILSHKTETVLELIRSKKMAPNAEIINILLTSFDVLREMINNPASQNEHDISIHVLSLQNLAESHLSGADKKALHSKVSITLPDKTPVEIEEIDVLAAKNQQQYIYVIEYDILNDLDRAGISPLHILNELSKIGIIIDSIFDLNHFGTLDDEPTKTIPVHLIYRTVLEPEYIVEPAHVDSSKIHIIIDPRSEKIKTEEKSQPVAVVEEKPIEPEPIQKKTVSPEPLPSSEQKKQPVTSQNISSSDTLRVSVDSLDTLMTQAGELVLGRNQLLDAIARQDKAAIVSAGQRISFVTSELQEAVMRTRLQPVGNVLNKFSRVIRDIAKTLKKEIKITIEGHDVELDKTIIEGLSDPLTHMIRNAADHGIESPEQRRALGKSPVGTIGLKAFHEAGQVYIEISDDGKGIDPAKIASKALGMKLITQERIQTMSDAEKRALIFLPGLSTAEKVSETSGRGVGMDVVKTNLDKLGGKVEINSLLGAGTTFRIKLPLTLAIIPSLIISENNERYALPQVNIIELHRIPASLIGKKIEVIGDAEVLILRGELIPLVRFTDVLDSIGSYTDPLTNKREINRRARLSDRRNSHHNTSLENTPLNDTDQRTGKDRRYHAVSDLNIVIISSGQLQYGLAVEQMHHFEEIVVKPLGRHLKGLSEYAGATIMGDGSVALILDATGLARKADINSITARNTNHSQNLSIEQNGKTDSISLLLFNNQADELCAVPLEYVQRVEHIKQEQLEMKAGRRTIQHRGSSLPLVQLSDIATVSPVPLDQELAVVVLSTDIIAMGILGIMPVSVVETHSPIDYKTHKQPGIIGSLIINEKTILLLDIMHILRFLSPEFEEQPSIENATPSVQGLSPMTILLAEDSDFFRMQVKSTLEDAGYRVLAAADGKEAWDLLDTNASMVHAIVTDIEMPNMNGLELSEKIRADNRFSHLPIIAVTSLAGEQDHEKCRNAGITEYQVKLDKDQLLSSLKGLISSQEIHETIEQTT